MTTLGQIKEFGTQLGLQFHAERVVLFGSHAQGMPTTDSDVDLLVIMPFEGKSVTQSVAMRMKLRPTFPVDILVRTLEMVRQRLAMGDDFVRRILEEGLILYEADH